MFEGVIVCIGDNLRHEGVGLNCQSAEVTNPWDSRLPYDFLDDLVRPCCLGMVGANPATPHDSEPRHWQWTLPKGGTHVPSQGLSLGLGRTPTDYKFGWAGL